MTQQTNIENLPIIEVPPELRGLSNEEIIKCFFTYELSFKDHRDVVRYVIKKEKEERKKRDK